MVDEAHKPFGNLEAGEMLFFHLYLSIHVMLDRELFDLRYLVIASEGENLIVERND